MSRNKTVLYALFIVLMPVAIILLSGNGVLRVSGTYGFFFNDIQASDYVDSSLSNNEIAGEITGYFNSLEDEEFQIYEKNGEFLDPVFDSSEVLVMKRVKAILLWTLGGGAVVFISAMVLYVYLRISGEKRHLRTTGIIACVVTVVLQIIKCILISMEAFRGKLYDRFIGIQLNEEASLRVLLGSPMERVYLIFSSIAVVVLVIVFLYIHLGVTKERGMFKSV